MELHDAVGRVLLGEPLELVAAAYRDELFAHFGLDPAEVRPTTFQRETRAFMNRLCRHLGERHRGDPRVGAALEAWVDRVDDYDAFDALLSGFRVDRREQIVQRGRALFPGPLTAHWDD